MGEQCAELRLLRCVESEVGMFSDDLASKDVVELGGGTAYVSVCFEPQRKHGSFAAKVLGKP
jgi:hypothetical protein